MQGLGVGKRGPMTMEDLEGRLSTIQACTGPRRPRRGRRRLGSGGAACCIGALSARQGSSGPRGASLKTLCRQPLAATPSGLTGRLIP